MNSTWITPTLILAGGTILSAVFFFIVRHIGKAARAVVHAVVVAALKDFKVGMDARFDHNDRETEAAKVLAESLQLELARQFGGNGGGIRQAINQQSDGLASLRGAFDQHIVEGKR